MARLRTFEELKSWQKSRELCKVIFDLTKGELFSKDYSLKDQIKRSSGSIMDNIAEGFDRSSNKEFRRFLFIAKGSSSEVKSQLYRSLDQKYITKEEFRIAFDKTSEIGKLIGGMISYLEGNLNHQMLKEESESFNEQNNYSLKTE